MACAAVHNTAVSAGKEPHSVQDRNRSKLITSSPTSTHSRHRLSGPLDRQSISALHSVAPAPVAERWADMARSLTLYPESSARVSSSLEAFLEALREGFTANSKGLEVAFSASGVWVNGEIIEQKDNPKLRWLRDRLFRSGLSGATFSENVSAAALLEFTKRLLSLYVRRDLNVGFDKLWPEPYAGIALLERRFDGTFAGRSVESGQGDHPMVADSNRLRALDLNAQLGRDETIRGEIDDLQAKLLALAGSDANFREFDLLAEIAALLPAEGLNDHAVAAEMTMRVLEELNLHFVEAPLHTDRAVPADDASFRRLLSVIGRSHFNRVVSNSQQESPATNVERPAQITNANTPAVTSDARAAENLVPEDLSLVVAAMHAAPDESPLLPEFEDTLEQLGVYLHHLVNYDDPRKFPALEAGIGRLIHASGDGAIDVMRHYVDPARSEQGALGKPTVGRLVECLTRCGLRQHLRRLGLLDVDWIACEFPYEFLTYLQGLDLGNLADLGELDHVCRKIGTHRLRQATDLFAGALEFMAGPIPRALMSSSLVSLVPLVRQIYEQDRRRYKAEFAGFLRGTAAKGVDQLVLDAVHDPQLLLPGYLSALAEESPEQLAQQRELCVRSVVTVTEGHLPQLAQHVRAINLLVHCDSQETRALLKRLKHERKHLIFVKHARAARQAATRVLLALKSGRGARRV